MNLIDKKLCEKIKPNREKNKRYHELTKLLDDYVSGISELKLTNIFREIHGHFAAGEMSFEHFEEINNRIYDIKNNEIQNMPIVKTIKEDIESAIKENTDNTLSLINIISLTLDKYTTLEIAEFYKNIYETDLRYFLEQRIERMFCSSN